MKVYYEENMQNIHILSAAMILAPAALQTYWKQQEQEMQIFLTSIQKEDLNRRIEGVTDEGTSYIDPVWHSMLHVLFHGAQHRRS